LEGQGTDLQTKIEEFANNKPIVEREK
jgi:hypothetical protein